ncbi:Pyridoxal biosynthesis protein PDX1 [Platanthera guangdongensis]|uniref:Pyridoxal biosynthesis protein PDX1 n=1 Tax=Platanthera guangdongensis TaxID=2320717 RepID=A0ABR2MUJ7_9ASPA
MLTDDSHWNLGNLMKAKRMFQESGDPTRRARAIVQAVTHYSDPEILADVSAGLGESVVGINLSDANDQSLARLNPGTFFFRRSRNPPPLRLAPDAALQKPPSLLLSRRRTEARFFLSELVDCLVDQNRGNYRSYSKNRRRARKWRCYRPSHCDDAVVGSCATGGSVATCSSLMVEVELFPCTIHQSILKEAAVLLYWDELHTKSSRLKAPPLQKLPLFAKCGDYAVVGHYINLFLDGHIECVVEACVPMCFRMGR